MEVFIKKKIFINIVVNYFIFVLPISKIILLSFFYLYWLNLFILLICIFYSIKNKNWRVFTMPGYLPNFSWLQILINLIFFLPKNSAFLTIFFFFLAWKNISRIVINNTFVKQITRFLFKLFIIFFMYNFFGIPGILYYIIRKLLFLDYKSSFNTKIMELFSQFCIMQKFENNLKIIVFDKVYLNYDYL